MKNWLLINIASLLFLTACGTDGTSIKGTINNAEGETIVLEKLSSSEASVIDSSEISSNGSFNIVVGELTEPAFYRLKLDDKNFVILLLDKDETVEVSGNSLDFYQSYNVSGSEGSANLRSLDKRLREAFEATDSLRGVFQAHQKAGHPRLDSIAQAIDGAFQEMQEGKRQFVLGFIDENSTSLASLSAVQSLNPEQDLDVFQQVSDNMTAALPESEYVKTFNARIADLKSRKQSAGRTEIGNEAPEIALLTPEGNTVKLSDFRGKITMIDFWASWCKPCRLENPNVVRVYNRFKDKGFEIFGVSLDRDKDKWIQAIAQDGLTWKHGSELKFWQSSFVPSYNLDGIPMTYLLDAEGIIIAKGLRGEQLEQKLEELFN